MVVFVVLYIYFRLTKKKKGLTKQVDNLVEDIVGTVLYSLSYF